MKIELGGICGWRFRDAFMDVNICVRVYNNLVVTWVLLHKLSNLYLLFPLV